MFGVVEDEHLGAWRLGSNQARILRHIARAIHLALVIDSNFHVDFSRDIAEATELYTLHVTS